ncbi:natural resistance-associated macrophage protein [Atractiella rhizophila]|nr:natural resistance-associated macrophage protein [Atractiella rhizophila]
MQGPRLPSHSLRGIDGFNLPQADIDAVETKPKRTASSIEAQDVERVQVAREEETEVKGWKRKKQKAWNVLKRHGKFVGPGIMASVAYFDPGNYATDLQAGSQYGYALLFVVLFSGICAILLQILATRLGCVTGRDLAMHCRRRLWNRDKYKWFFNSALILLYVVCEGAIILTDLAELLGSAIAINLLIPRIPLWGGILLTSTDVLLILLLFNSYPSRVMTRSMRIFEAVIAVLVFTVLISFVILLIKMSPDAGEVLKGYLPSDKIVNGGALYVAVGIVGATVMPHALFLGSRLATMERIPREEYLLDTNKISPPTLPQSAQSDIPPPSPALSHSSRPNANISLHMPQPVHLHSLTLSPKVSHSDSPKDGKNDGKDDPLSNNFVPPSLETIRAHLTHATIDVGLSLFGFAILINSSILIIGGAAFYYGDEETRGEVDGDLFGAYELIKQHVGQFAAYLFAIALLASGQSASITATLAGQVVSEGFINWRTSPWVRRLVTRGIGIVPSLAVAIAVGKNGVNTLLVGSQVGLSVALPFVIAPLVLFTSEHSIMSTLDPTAVPSPAPENQPSPWRYLNPFRRRTEQSKKGMHSFANPFIVVWVGTALLILVSIADVYALYQVGVGE